MRLETTTTEKTPKTEGLGHEIGPINPQVKTTETESEYGIFWGSDLFSVTKHKAPLIDHFLYEHDTIFITAQPGVGKSILALQMLAALTSAEPFLGCFDVPRQCNVLYLQTEGDRVETQDRIKSMERGVKFDHSRWVHINLDGICLNTSEGYAKFVEMASMPKMNYDVVIIDPLYTTVKGSLNSDEVATDWIRYARAIRRKYKCAFIVLHHESIKEHYIDGAKVSKGDKDLMGSTYWGAFVSFNYKLTDNKKDKTYTLTRGKERNNKTIDKLSMKMLEPEPLMFVVADDKYSLSEAQISTLLIKETKPLLVKEIMEITELSKATVYRVIRGLVIQKKVVKIEDGNNVRYTGAI